MPWISDGRNGGCVHSGVSMLVVLSLLVQALIINYHQSNQLVIRCRTDGVQVGSGFATAISFIDSSGTRPTFRQYRARQGNIGVGIDGLKS